MTTYAEPERSARPPYTSIDISRLFRKADDWFDRARVRRRLYARGFPHPFERGRWDADLVDAWRIKTSANPEGVPPSRPRRRRRRAASSGYASA